MVNTVKLLRHHLLARLFKNAGLRQHAVAVEDDGVAVGTIINFWLPKRKAPPSKMTTTKKKTSSTTSTTKNHISTAEEEQRRHAVVLLHGFAADGLMTWAFQVGALAERGYDVYVPDLLHFGRSTTASPDRTMAFQARCVAAALRGLGVEENRRCTVTVVGFSYGALVAFEMAAACPGLVRSVVATGSAAVFTAATHDALLERLCPGTSFAELMVPVSARRLRLLFSTALYMKLRWFPRRVLDDFLRHKVMCRNRQERAEMLEKMVTRDKQASTHVFHQVHKSHSFYFHTSKAGEYNVNPLSLGGKRTHFVFDILLSA
uniref:Uncharacterized protein n=1 Tax=Avena sativa TaxID=4498 RepID=A0ACD5Z7R1_AVESA